MSTARPFNTSDDLPLTIGYIRNELRNNRYIGNTFDALRYLLSEYDQLWSKYRRISNPQEYTVTRYTENGEDV